MKPLHKAIFSRTSLLAITLPGLAWVWAATGALAQTLEAPPSAKESGFSQMDAIQLALHHNRALEAERKNLRIAHGIALETRAVLLPQLKLDGQYQRFNAQVPDGDTLGLPVPQQLWMGGIRLSQSIYEGGRMRSATHTAKWTQERAIDQYDQVLSGVILKVRLAYQEALLAQAQIHFTQEFEQTQKSEITQVTDKVQAGSLPKLELIQAEVELASLDAKLITAKNQLKLSLIRLLDVVGIDSSESAADSLRLSDGLTLEPLTVEMSEAVQSALANRADLKALENTVRLSGEDVASSSGSYKPSVQLVGGYAGLEDPLGRDLYGWFAGAQASWVWFDGLKSQGRSEQAKAGHEKNQIELEDLKKQVDVEVRTAYFSLIEARERHSALQKALDSASEALRQTRVESEAGGATRFDVLRAARALQDIQVSQLEALYSYNSALAKLDYSMGLSPAGNGPGSTNYLDGNPKKN
jgi:outer membrane protein